jgi:hypothetical protein
VPSAIVDKYLAITAVDSRSFAPSEQDLADGWSANSGIAYSPRMESMAILPSNCCCRECCGYDEWYVFERQPPSLGSVCHANVFTSEIGSGNVFQFINFIGFESNPILTATIEGIIFSLRPDLNGYRWYWPNGRPTDLCRETVDEAQRLIAFRWLELVRQSPGVASDSHSI